MWTWIILFTLLILMFAYYSRLKKPAKAVLFGMGSGILTFGIVGYFTTGLLNFTWFNLLISVIAGIPGVLTAIVLGQFV